MTARSTPWPTATNRCSPSAKPPSPTRYSRNRPPASTSSPISASTTSHWTAPLRPYPAASPRGIRLATQIGSGLTGVLYVCDEPTVGLHPADDSRLINTLLHLRDLGNTVIVVEHDEAVMRAADHILDMGPGAGEHGGHLVASGTMQEIMEAEGSVTGDYLSGRRQIPSPKRRS